MSYQIAEDAKPKLNLLLWATVASVLLFVISWYLPLMSWVVYPLQLFATFVHEGSHVLAAVLTGSPVSSLTVSPDTSGVVWSTANGWLASLFISSAGYLGAIAYGTALLVWMRYSLPSQIGLYISAGFVGVMTLVFGLIFPIFNIMSANVTVGSVAFTVISGLVLTAGLFAIGRYAGLRWTNFALAFLSVQCLLNAFSSLHDLFVTSATSDLRSDAVNMANSTGIPAIMWVFIWIGISVLMIGVGLRIYAVSQKSS